MTDLDQIHRLAQEIEAEGYSVREWEGDDGRIRLYVSRQLSRRKQTMGYIELREDGTSNVYAERMSSSFHRWHKSLTS